MADDKDVVRLKLDVENITNEAIKELKQQLYQFEE